MNFWFKVKMTTLSVYHGMNVRIIAGNLSAFLRLYHESLQSLVQGYREVTMDAKGEFRFDKDGSTVQERMDRLEGKLGEYSSGVVRRIDESKKKK